MRFRTTLLMVLLVAGCGGDGESENTTPQPAATTASTAEAVTTTTSGETSSTDASAPWGLDKIAMPDTAPAVEAVFAALPAEVGGRSRSDVPGRVEGAYGVEYGDWMHAISALPVAAIDPEMTALSWLEMTAGGMEGEIEGSDLAADAPLAWIASSEQADDEIAYITSWCVPEGEWYFSVVADSPATRLELIESFIAAVANS